jgi:hypothetical protein
MTRSLRWPEVPLLTWISLLFFLAALIGSGTVAGLHGLRTWRAARALSGAAGPEVDRISRGAEEAERRAAALSDGNEQLAVAVERLQRSLAQLAILRNAAERARKTLDLRHVLPRK